jgi:hypothetical protein
MKTFVKIMFWVELIGFTTLTWFCVTHAPAAKVRFMWIICLSFFSAFFIISTIIPLIQFHIEEHGRKYNNITIWKRILILIKK